MRPVAFLLALLGGLLSSVGATPARAWTEANVEEATAHVEVDDEGHARVGLVLTVRIHGGWLEGLDLEGLDPDITLIEEKAPSAVSVDDPSLKWRLTARPREDGGLRLSFPRRGSPRRGRIRITLAYTTNLSGRGAQPIEDERVRVSWTLPAWRSGLESAVVTLTTPAGAIAGPEMSDGPDTADEIVPLEADGVTSHVFRRLHLPRTIPWTVSVELPADAMAPALRGPRVIRPESSPNAESGEPGTPLVPFIFLALPLLAALGSRLSFDWAARRRGLVSRPIVPGPGWLIAPAMLGLGALAYQAAFTHPSLSLALLAAGTALSLQRTPRQIIGPPTASLEPVDRQRLLGARRAMWWARLFGAPLLDLTTLGGAALFVSLGTGAVFFGGATSGLPPATVGVLFLIVLPFTLATRLHLPATVDAKLLRLRALASTLEDIGPTALALLGAPNDARLRVSLASPPPGLLCLDLVVTDTPSLGGFESGLALLVVTETGSAAEERLDRAGLGHGTEDAEGRRFRLSPLSEAPTAQLRHLIRAMTSPGLAAPNELSLAA